MIPEPESEQNCPSFGASVGGRMCGLSIYKKYIKHKNIGSHSKINIICVATRSPPHPYTGGGGGGGGEV